MKVYGGKPDYWDTAIGFGGIDPTIHYSRDENGIFYSNIKNKLPQEITELVGYENSQEHTSERIVIGFCGKLYPGIRFYPVYGVLSVSEQTIAYDLKSIPIIPTKKASNARSRPYWHYFSPYKDTDHARKQFFSYREFVCDELFIELHTPVFLYRSAESRRSGAMITINQNLKELQFYKIRDPFSAFQEIASYIGNQLVQFKTPQEIDDKYKVAQHGYDPKYSFRRRP